MEPRHQQALRPGTDARLGDVRERAVERGEGRGWEEGDVCEGVEEGAPDAVEVGVRGLGKLGRVGGNNGLRFSKQHTTHHKGFVQQRVPFSFPFLSPFLLSPRMGKQVIEPCAINLNYLHTLGL